MTTTKGGAQGTRLVTGVFAKRPRAGEVKTRLEPALGGAGAATFARALLVDAARRLDQADLGLELVFAPAEERDWFAKCFPGHRLTAQHGDGLAARMEHWFGECLGAGGARRSELAIAVGSDSPWTSAARVRAAADLLAGGKDVVLGPDLGGGYYLVGLRRALPGLFTDITMSTRSMFHETVAWLEKRDLSFALLEEDYDVDTPEDLRHLRHELSEVLDVADGKASAQTKHRSTPHDELPEVPMRPKWADQQGVSAERAADRSTRRPSPNDLQGRAEEAADSGAAAGGTHRPSRDDPSWPHAVAACLKALDP
ncbi:MAG: TIGR04282 family arsenosugar biosynthesis glycosyltransferase [Planctomycetota bacterium]|nr:TIGR04282 family arsenosugar biosynthesis glycosyltransferase [Planctomycetota bacterium]